MNLYSTCSCRRARALGFLVLTATLGAGCYESVDVRRRADPLLTLELRGRKPTFLGMSEGPVVGARVVAERCEDGARAEGTSGADGRVTLTLEAADCFTITALSPDGRTGVTFLETPPPDAPLDVTGFDAQLEGLGSPIDALIINRLARSSRVQLLGAGVMVGLGPNAFLGIETPDAAAQLFPVVGAESPFLVAVELDNGVPVQAARFDIDGSPMLTVRLPGVRGMAIEHDVFFEMPSDSAIDPFALGLDESSTARGVPSLTTRPPLGTGTLSMFEVRATPARRSLVFVGAELAAFGSMAGLGAPRAIARLSDARDELVAFFDIPFDADLLSVPRADDFSVDGVDVNGAHLQAGGRGFRSSGLFSATGAGGTFTLFVRVAGDDLPLDLVGLPPLPNGSAMADAFAAGPVDAQVSLTHARVDGASATFRTQRRFAP